MAVDSDSSYRYLGTGAALALEVSGPSVEACLARAVEGFTAAYADVHPSIVPRCLPLAVDGANPAALLHAILDASVQLTGGGELALSAGELRLDRGRLSGAFHVVPAAAAALTVELPVIVLWHDLSLERHDGHWWGRIVAEV